MTGLGSFFSNEGGFGGGGSGGSGGGGSADAGATYLLLLATGSLPAARTFSVSGSTGLYFVDSGAGSTMLLSIDDDIVATLSGSIFSGRLYASGGLTGSLQQVAPGVPYLLASGGISLSTNSLGQVTITGASAVDPFDPDALYIVTDFTSSLNNERRLVAGNGIFINDGGPNADLTVINIKPGDISASYVVIGATGSLPNERSLAAGVGISVTDGGAGATVSVSVDPNLVVMRSGSSMTGPLILSGGLTGSLQKTIEGLSYLVGGANITITSQSNGQIVLSAPNTANSHSAGPGIEVNNSTFKISTFLTGATGVRLTTGSQGEIIVSGSTLVAGDNITLSIDANLNIAISASAADISASYVVVGATGSLPHERVLTAGPGIFLDDGGSGAALTIVNTKPGDISASYITIGVTGSLPNERSLAAGTGISVTDGGAGAAVTVAIRNDVVATLTGSTFSGPITATAAGLTGSITGSRAGFAQITGSHTLLESGLSYLVGGGTVTITSMSNGQVLISGSGGGGGAGTVTSVSASFPLSSTLGTTPLISLMFPKPTFYLGDGALTISPADGTDFVLPAGVLTAARTVRILTSSSGPRQSINMWMMSQSYTLTVVNNGPITGTIYTGSNGTPTLSKYFFDSSDWNLDWYERLS